MNLLEIRNLHVKVKNKLILKGVNLRIKEKEIHALFGPNASGKTTLAFSIIGIPNYKIVKGKILFLKKEITKLKIEKRIKMGIGLAFQNPPALKGVKLSTLLKRIAKVDIREFKDILKEDLLERDVNVNFSGGEKKLSELIQVLSLKPKLLILDEIDSGLDIRKIKKIGLFLNKYFRMNKVSMLLITHVGKILQYINPHYAHVMMDGKIICTSTDWKKVLRTVEKHGYEKCKKCKLFAD